MNEDARLHLQMIQDVISRMASNSFALKGWSVTVTAALVGLSAKDANPAFAVVALYPALSFWGLDAYFLRQERLYRALYDAVRTDRSVPLFSMNTAPFGNGVASLGSIARSGTVCALHLPVIAAIAAVLLYTFSR